jgi:RNA polymerase sigma factor FliA
LTDQEESELWSKFKKDNCQESRNLLIEAYLPLVKRIAERMFFNLNGKVEKDDLFSTGLLGLIDATEKYMPSRNIKFITYSTQRIRGSMLDDVRAKDWVPRTSRVAFQTYSTALNQLKHSLQRTPSDEEMMEELKMDAKEFHKLCCEVNIPTMTSIQGLSTYDNEENSDDWVEDSRSNLEAKGRDQKEFLSKIINDLPEKKKAALIMYYYEEMTLKEISKVLEITEGRVSQILSAVIAQLKSQYSSQTEDLL